jgi:hypothetical protein
MRGDVLPHNEPLLAGSSDQSPGSRVSIFLVGTKSSFRAGSSNILIERLANVIVPELLDVPLAHFHLSPCEGAMRLVGK